MSKKRKKNKGTAYQELLKLKKSIPYAIYIDVYTRATDWLRSGGDENDLYIQKQLDYARQHLLEKIG